MSAIVNWFISSSLVFEVRKESLFSVEMGENILQKTQESYVY